MEKTTISLYELRYIMTILEKEMQTPRWWQFRKEPQEVEVQKNIIFHAMFEIDGRHVSRFSQLMHEITKSGFTIGLPTNTDLPAVVVGSVIEANIKYYYKISFVKVDIENRSILFDVEADF